MVGPGESAAPPLEGLERFSLGKFARPGRHGGGPAGRALRLSPQGRAGCSASPGRPAGVEGREPPSGTARSARLLPRSRRDAAVGPRGARNTPLFCRRGGPNAPREPCAWPRPPAGHRCGAFCRRGDPPGRSAERGISLPAPPRREGARFSRRGRRPGLRGLRGGTPARASSRLPGCGRDSSSARGCVLVSRRGASSWGRG